jgi:hypothetical protein
MAEGDLVERLRQYLRGLSPEARSLLMTELERGQLRGEDMSGAELVLQELRRDARANSRPKRPGNLARLFFQPLEPFLVDDSGPHSPPGRIPRTALEPIWEWICRDLMPGEAKAVTEQVARAFENDEAERAAVLAKNFQDRAVLRIEEALARRRLTGQTVTPRALQDVAAVLTVIKARHTLATFAAQLPVHIVTRDESDFAGVKVVLDSLAAQHPELFVYGLVIAMGRLGASWQLIRLASHAAGSNDAKRIADTPYAVCVDIVISEIQRLIDELKMELRVGSGTGAVTLVNRIHGAVHGSRAHIRLSDESSWARAFAAVHTEFSDLLKGEIETLPGRVRRLLRPRPLREIAPNSALDQGSVAEIEAQIALVKTCRGFAADLALGELTARAWSDLEHYLEPAALSLVESLGLAGETDRGFRESQVDAAVRFCRPVFGDGATATILKARDRAVAARPKQAKG